MVTGAAGSLGSRLLGRLLAHPGVDRVVGLDVVPCAGSDPRLDARVIDLAARPAPGDPELAEALAGATSVLHLAWAVSDRRGAPFGEQSAVTAANQRALARVLAAAAKAGVESFVHLSSATVYGAWPDNKIPLTEDERIRPNPEFAFAVSKAEAERTVADWADQHPSVAVAVLRPTVVVSSGDRPLYQALGITRSPRHGDGGRPVQYLHIDDLAAAVMLVWERRLAGVYNVAADAGIPEEQARALAGGVARIAVPERLAVTASSLAWRLWRKGVPVEARAYAAHPWAVSPDRLRAAGWTPGYSSEEALVATDERVHWDDLPPGRRQNYNLLIAVGVLVLAGTGAGVVVELIRRRRRRSRAS